MSSLLATRTGSFLVGDTVVCCMVTSAGCRCDICVLKIGAVCWVDGGPDRIIALSLSACSVPMVSVVNTIWVAIVEFDC